MDSNRGNGIATKLGVVIALVIAVAAIGWGWNYGLRQERTYEQEAGQAYADQAKNRCFEIAKPDVQSPSVEKTDSKPCIPSEEAQKANDNRRDYADLVAQRSSALWAKIMGIAALIGIGLSFVGVALVWITFRETRKANEIAGAIGFKQLRAYVTVESAATAHVSFDGENQNYQAVRITLHNSGATPAVSVLVKVRKFVVCEDVSTQIDELISVPDIGGQARQIVNLPWYLWSEFIKQPTGRQIEQPKTITGEIHYKTAIPDDTGQVASFVSKFDIEPADGNRREAVAVDIIRMPSNNRF